MPASPDRKNLVFRVHESTLKKLNALIPTGKRNMLLDFMVQNFISHLESDYDGTLERYRESIINSSTSYLFDKGESQDGS